MIVGWPDKPYRGRMDFVLRGNHFSPSFRYQEDQEGPPMGSKGMGESLQSLTTVAGTYRYLLHTEYTEFTHNIF